MSLTPSAALASAHPGSSSAREQSIPGVLDERVPKLKMKRKTAALLREAADEVMANGGSCIASPTGTWLLEPETGVESLRVAELDHGIVLEERQSLDVAGHYSRPDVTQLLVDRRRQSKGRALNTRPMDQAIPGAGHLVEKIGATVVRKPAAILVAAGVVTWAGPRATYGNTVEIDHGNGYRTVYAHMQNYLVKRGESVQQGQVIGQVGSSGRSTGPHLHYEIRLHQNPVNPTKFLNVADLSHTLTYVN